MKLLIPVLEMSPVNYVNAVKGCGGEADVTNRLCEIDEYDGLLLPGGADMDPSYYHEENKGSRDINKPLDELQLSFFRKFYEADKPILGICRGFHGACDHTERSLRNNFRSGCRARSRDDFRNFVRSDYSCSFGGKHFFNSCTDNPDACAAG